MVFRYLREFHIIWKWRSGSLEVTICRNVLTLIIHPLMIKIAQIILPLCAGLKENQRYLRNLWMKSEVSNFHRKGSVGYFSSVPSVFVNHLCQLLVEVFFMQQFFQREMHPVAPIVTWIGWYVDAFGLYVRIA